MNYGKGSKKRNAKLFPIVLSFFDTFFVCRIIIFFSSSSSSWRWFELLRLCVIFVSILLLFLFVFGSFSHLPNDFYDFNCQKKIEEYQTIYQTDAAPCNYFRWFLLCVLFHNFVSYAFEWPIQRAIDTKISNKQIESFFIIFFCFWIEMKEEFSRRST